MKQYRELRIKEVERFKEQTHLHFEDCIVSLTCNNEQLLRTFKIHPEDLLPGRRVLIRGRSGNTDAHLCGINVIEEILLSWDGRDA